MFTILLIPLMTAFVHAAPEPSTDFEVWRQTTAERLAEALNAQNKITTSMLSRNLGIGRSSIYRILNGSLPMTVDLGLAIATALDRSPEWLLAYDVIRERFISKTSQGDLPGRAPRIIRRLITLAGDGTTPNCTPSLLDMAEALRKAGWTVLPPEI